MICVIIGWSTIVLASDWLTRPRVTGAAEAGPELAAPVPSRYVRRVMTDTEHVVY